MSFLPGLSHNVKSASTLLWYEAGSMVVSASPVSATSSLMSVFMRVDLPVDVCPKKADVDAGHRSGAVLLASWTSGSALLASCLSSASYVSSFSASISPYSALNWVRKAAFCYLYSFTALTSSGSVTYFGSFEPPLPMTKLATELMMAGMILLASTMALITLTGQ